MKGINMADDVTEEDMDPSVPTELLELHVLLEEEEVSPKEFKEVYGNDADRK